MSLELDEANLTQVETERVLDNLRIGDLEDVPDELREYDLGADANRLVNRSKYRTFITATKEADEGIVKLSQGEVVENIRIADKMIERAYNTTDAAHDAMFLECSASLGMHKLKDLRDSDRKFDPVNFAQKLRRFCVGDDAFLELEMENEQENFKKTDIPMQAKYWTKIGAMLKPMLHEAPTLRSLHGTFPIEAEDESFRGPKEKRPRQKYEKMGLEAVTSAFKQTAEQADEGQTTTKYVNYVDKELRKKWRKCDGRMGLLEFVLHPTDFGQTIENLFCVSFLVREGMVNIQLDENDLPYLYESEKSKREKLTGENQEQPSTSSQSSAILGLNPETTRTKTGDGAQFIFEMTMGHWEKMVAILGIKEPVLKKKRHHQEVQ